MSFKALDLFFLRHVGTIFKSKILNKNVIPIKYFYTYILYGIVEQRLKSDLIPCATFSHF